MRIRRPREPVIWAAQTEGLTRGVQPALASVAQRSLLGPELVDLAPRSVLANPARIVTRGEHGRHPDARWPHPARELFAEYKPDSAPATQVALDEMLRTGFLANGSARAYERWVLDRLATLAPAFRRPHARQPAPGGGCLCGCAHEYVPGPTPGRSLLAPAAPQVAHYRHCLQVDAHGEPLPSQPYDRYGVLLTSADSVADVYGEHVPGVFLRHEADYLNDLVAGAAALQLSGLEHRRLREAALLTWIRMPWAATHRLDRDVLLLIQGEAAYQRVCAYGTTTDRAA